MKKEKLAILDVDGTLFDGRSGFFVMDQLIEDGAISKDVGDEVYRVAKDYADGKIEHSEIYNPIYTTFGKGIKGVSEKTVRKASQSVFEKEKSKIFSFAPYLVKRLKSDGFTVVMISGSPIEFIRKIANYLDVKHVFALTYEIKDGVYTGKRLIEPTMDNGKRKILEEFAIGRDIDWKNSISMGDSDTDMDTFLMAGNPIIFEPDQSMDKILKSKDWPIANRSNILSILETVLLASLAIIISFASFAHSIA